MANFPFQKNINVCDTTEGLLINASDKFSFLTKNVDVYKK